MTQEDDRDDSVLAAEYVLDLLSVDERRAVELRLRDDAGLSREVALWREQLVPLTDDVGEVAPDRETKARIERRLFGEKERTVPVWRRLWIWQGLTVAGLALAGFMGWQQLAPKPALPLYVSEIMAEDNSLRLLAVYSETDGTLQINRTAGEAASGRALELWAIQGQNAPVSLGVLPAGPTARIAMPDALKPVISGLVLAVSDEPPGGSPTGQPTGAVVAVGPVTPL